MPMPENFSVSTLADFIGHDFGSFEPMMVDQSRINGFADVTGDHQWIHVDEEKAKASPFGGTIAHGFLTLSLVAAAAGSAGVVPPDAKAFLNYGLDKARFLSPVPSGSSVVVNFKLAGVEDKGPGNQLMKLDATLSIEGAEKPAVIAEVLALIIG